MIQKDDTKRWLKSVVVEGVISMVEKVLFYIMFSKERWS